MMRAWAAISVTAVLVALPASVERAAAGTVGAVGTAGTGGTVAADAVPNLAGSAVTVAAVPPTNLGVMLWLSVAVVAAVVACLVLHHSRTHFAPAIDAAAPPVRFSSGFPAGPFGNSDDAAPSAAIGG